MTPRLPLRLRAVLHMVPEQARAVADIGAGHGALSAHLVARCAHVVAVEVRPGPYDELRANLDAWRLTTRVEVRHGDGLSVLRRGEVDTAVIAGVGAHTALRIAAPAPRAGIRWLVLQCMQHAALVEPWVRSRGWQVLQRYDVRERRHCYPTWLVEVGG
jgi:tRNA (adenine22-N1)-methyltransferase